MRKNVAVCLLASLVVAAVLVLGCGGSGGGGGVTGPVAGEAENGAVLATVHGFLAAAQSDDPQSALRYCSSSLQAAGGSQPLIVTDLIGKQYEFTVMPGEFEYLTPDLVVAKAFHDQIETFRVTLTFRLVRETGAWFIDEISMQSTPIPTPFFVETVKVGATPIGTDKTLPASLATTTPSFEVAFNVDAVQLDAATWTVRITDQNTQAILTNAASSDQFHIVPAGARGVLIAVGTTPGALQSGGLYALEFSAPSLQNASGTSLATPAARFFTVSVEPPDQGTDVQIPTVQGIASGSYNTDQTFAIVAAAGKSYEYSLDNGISWLAYTGPVTLSSEGTSVIVTRERVTGQAQAPLSPAVTVTVDKTAPSAPTLAGITAGTFQAAQTFRVTGAEAGGILYYSLDNGTTPLVYSSDVVLTNLGTYQVVAWQVDAAGNAGARSSAIAVAIALPAIAWAGGYPKTTDQGPFAMKMAFKTTLAGTVNYVVLPAESAAPSAAQVQAGTDAAGENPAAQGSVAVSAGTEVVVTVSGLALGASYDVWSVAAGQAGSAVGPTAVAVTIPAGFTRINAGAEWSARSRFSPVWFADRLWVIGGGDGDIPLAQNDVWNSPDGISWTRTTAAFDGSTPGGRESHGVAVFGGKLWVLGGRLNSNGLLSNQIFNSSDGVAWTPVGTGMDTWGGNSMDGLIRFGLVPYRPAGGAERLYLLGGHDGFSVKDTVWASENGLDWVSAAPFTEEFMGPRQSFGCAVFQGKIFVLGGEGTNGPLGDTWTFDGTAWTQGADAPWGSRTEMKTVVLGNNLFACGGRDGNGDPANDLWYSPDGQAWTQVVGPLPSPARTEAGFVTDGFHLYILGGDTVTLTPALLNDVWRF